MDYPYSLPPALPVPVEGATAEEWTAYTTRNFFVYNLQARAEEDRLLAEHRKSELALRERGVVAQERLAAAGEATTEGLIAASKVEAQIARFKLLADIVERRGTDRTASGNLDQVKLTADMQAILAVAHATLVNLAAALPETQPAEPGLSG